jgi:hypothetical protein
MKSIVLLVLFTAGFSVAKAQQSTLFNPNIKLTDSLNFFKPNNKSPKSFLLQPDVINNPAIFTDKNTRIVYSSMPVAKLSSDDRMPVAYGGRSANQDNMPVLKINIVDPLVKKSEQQQVP